MNQDNVQKPAKIHYQLNVKNTDQSVKITIPYATLKRLFNEGKLWAAELHCHDLASKKLVQELCLKVCLKNYSRIR